MARTCTAGAILLAAVALVLLSGGVADAGEWVQVSCINPNQTGAGSAGWFSVIAGGGYGSDTSTPCGPGSPMFAILSTDAAVGVSSAETPRYIPPAGSTLNGGLLDLGMYADGRGAGAYGTVGASRLMLLAYRAYSNDPVYTTQAGVQETVTAGVQMHVTPRRTSSAGSITLAGHVAGPLPRRGVAVELLVHYRGHWEPLRTPRTGSNGRFSVPYQFQGAIGRFPFRAEVFGGQSGFPYATGESTPVDVATN